VVGDILATKVLALPNCMPFSKSRSALKKAMSKQKKLHHPKSNRSENDLADLLCKERSIFLHYIVTAVVKVHQKTVMNVIRGGQQ
jgi:hypothetical protein